VSDPVSRSDPASRRIGTRLRRRLGAALLIGPLAGLAIGAVTAALAFESWGRGSIMVLVGAVIAGTILALLWGGYSSLESPDPGREPSDTRRPLADREDLVREESGDPLGDDSQQRLPDGRSG
jgi:hypothetical protein